MDILIEWNYEWMIDVAQVTYKQTSRLHLQLVNEAKPKLVPPTVLGHWSDCIPNVCSTTVLFVSFFVSYPTYSKKPISSLIKQID